VEEFKKVWQHKEPDKGMLVPLLIWCSGYKPNIELCQSINKKFFTVEESVLLKDLALGNKLNHFIKYPKKEKNDDIDFLMSDICNYYGWTSRELELNRDMIDVDSIKEQIAQSYGYTSEERKKIKVSKLSFKGK
jgi:hypothetical protein